MPWELHQLLWRQTCLRLNIRVFKVSVVQPTALSQITQEITIRDIFNDNEYRICQNRQYNNIRTYKVKIKYIRLSVKWCSGQVLVIWVYPSKALNLFIGLSLILKCWGRCLFAALFKTAFLELCYQSLKGVSTQMWPTKSCYVRAYTRNARIYWTPLVYDLTFVWLVMPVYISNAKKWLSLQAGYIN